MRITLQYTVDDVWLFVIGNIEFTVTTAMAHSDVPAGQLLPVLSVYKLHLPSTHFPCLRSPQWHASKALDIGKWTAKENTYTKTFQIS